MARVVELVVAIGWAAFWLYWLVAAFSRKRGRVPWSRELGIRAVIAVVVSGLGRLCTGEDSPERDVLADRRRRGHHRAGPGERRQRTR
jgi:hypothetical protein